MEIATTDREIGELIYRHHVYGAEAVINALVRAAKKEPYLDKYAVLRMVERAFDREEGRS